MGVAFAGPAKGRISLGPQHPALTRPWHLILVLLALGGCQKLSSTFLLPTLGSADAPRIEHQRHLSSSLHPCLSPSLAVLHYLVVLVCLQGDVCGTSVQIF